MLTDNFIEKEITFPKGQFIKACEQVSIDFGIKGKDWFNVMCMRKGDKEVMRFRHKAPVTISHWDAFDMLPAGAFEEFLECEGDKKEYLLEDVEAFIRVINS